MIAEVCRDRKLILPQSETKNDESCQGKGLDHGENILDHGTQFHSESIQSSECKNDADSDGVGRVDSDVHIAQNHRADVNSWDVRNMPKPMGA